MDDMEAIADGFAGGSPREWLWGLGERQHLWFASESDTLRAGCLTVELLEETGPCEFERVTSPLAPSEVEILSRYSISEGGDSLDILALAPCCCGDACGVKYAVRHTAPTAKALAWMLHAAEEHMVDVSRLFLTKGECEEYCRKENACRFSKERCDSLLASLEGMSSKIRAIGNGVAAEGESCNG